MLILVKVIGNIEGANVFVLAMQVIIGGISYFSSLLILKDKLLLNSIKVVLDKVKGRIS